MDAVVYDRMFAPNTQGPDENPRGLECWTIDPSRGSPSHGAVERRILDRSPQEFPQIDERRTRKPHRFLYSLGPPETANEYLAGATHVLKHDLETGARQLHDFGTGRFPGEFVFVPHRADAPEDDGWVISFVVDMQRSVTELAILDARAVETEPVATITIPHRVPAGFHGNWVADRTDG